CLRIPSRLYSRGAARLLSESDGGGEEGVGTRRHARRSAYHFGAGDLVFRFRFLASEQGISACDRVEPKLCNWAPAVRQQHFVRIRPVRRGDRRGKTSGRTGSSLARDQRGSRHELSLCTPLRRSYHTTAQNAGNGSWLLLCPCRPGPGSRGEASVRRSDFGVSKGAGFKR